MAIEVVLPRLNSYHLTEKYFEIGMKLNDFSIQLVKYCYQGCQHMIMESFFPSKYSPGFFGGEIGSDVGDDKDHQGQQDEDFHHIVNDEVDTCSKARIRCNPEHLICQFVSNPLKGIEYINHFWILLLEIYYLFFIIMHFSIQSYQYTLILSFTI